MTIKIASELLVRFYFEEPHYIASDVWRHVPLDIENLDDMAHRLHPLTHQLQKRFAALRAIVLDSFAF